MDEIIETARAGLEGLRFDPAVTARATDAFARWVADPSHAEDLPQLRALVAAGRFDAILDAFWQVMPFGTGGRRGPVGIGPNRFNAHALLGSVQGHAELLALAHPGRPLTVVVAFDVRVFLDRRGVYDGALPNPLLGRSSADFAARAAGVYAANGVSVLMPDPRVPEYISTPELSLAIRRHGAQGGLNVSASHNHPDDNGGKFYNHHGGQDVPPDDEILAQRVEAIAAVRELPFEAALAAGRVRFLGPEDGEAYLALNAGLGLRRDARGGRIVYTPLNGTGRGTVGRLLRQQGFRVDAVPEQEDYDGRFATVKFLAPNPEQPSCYERAERVADQTGADVIMATDPDADRIGIEVRGREGGWRFLNGDETLLLIVEHVIGQRRAAGTLPPDGFVLKTLVTTSRVTTIARAHGVQVVDDLLVGFKYMAAVLAELERAGRWRHLVARSGSLLLGVEESHGVLMTSGLRDKDAAGPALALAELNALCRAEGRTLLDELDRIQASYGPVANRLFTTVMTGAQGQERIRAIQASLRREPPATIDGLRVEGCTDLSDPKHWLGPIRSGTDAAARDVLVFRLEGGRRLVIRPSGTEPKNKTYVEVAAEPPSTPLSASELERQRARCDAEALALGRAFDRLALQRVGLSLSVHAEALSGLLAIDQKLHFDGVFLPELTRRAAAGAASGEFVDEALRAYGAQPRDLVAGGIRSWLPASGLAPAARDVVAALFGLPSARG